MGDEKYIIQTICTGNICRSRMAQGILKDLVEKAGLEELMEVKSSGLKVDKIRKWGAGGYMPVDSILRVLDAAYRNAVLESQYMPLAEGALADRELTKERHDTDDSFKDRLNDIASRAFKMISQLDMASTMLVMAEHDLVYPVGEPVQFREDGSSLYVPMEKKLVEGIKGQVPNPQSVRCFDEFTPGMEMKSSLVAINYNNGKLDIIDFRKIYEQVEFGCRNLMQVVEKELK
jgi:hypothetical protein